MQGAATLRPAVPRVRTVTLEHPWRWLAAGWADLAAAPGQGFGTGALAALAGFLLLFGLARAGLDYVIVPMGLGFTLLGPVAAVGLYETSRRLERGRDARWDGALAALRRNPGQVGLAAAFLLLAFMAWVRLALLEFALAFGSSPPALPDLLDRILLSDAGFALVAAGTVTGAVVAAAVFSLTVVALPMLVDRRVDAVTAMVTSLHAVRANPRPMALWAFLIALFTLSGLAMFFVGVMVTLPLLGHASWHAYRDLVVREE